MGLKGAVCAWWGGLEGAFGQRLINHRRTVLAQKKCRARRNSARRLTFKRERATAEIIWWHARRRHCQPATAATFVTRRARHGAGEQDAPQWFLDGKWRIPQIYVGQIESVLLQRWRKTMFLQFRNSPERMTAWRILLRGKSAKPWMWRNRTSCTVFYAQSMTNYHLQ